MAILVVARTEILPGREMMLQGAAPGGSLSAMFEDDGESGYFYALDSRKAGNPIEDAVLIYVVGSLVDRHLSSTIQIGWSEDHQKTALLVNGSIHAVFDFSCRRGYARSGFPQPSAASSWVRAIWTETVEELFR